MQKLTEMITHNFGWKMLSLVVAIAIWFFIVNITNPTKDQMISVLLRVDGQEALRENSIVLLNNDELESTFINLMLRGSYSSHEQAREDRDNGKLYAYIDLSPIDISRTSEFGQRLPIRVKYGKSSPNYDILNSMPGEVDVVLDKYITRTFPIIPQKIDNDMQGYITSEPVIKPENVEISGPMSTLAMIKEVRAHVEVGAAMESFETVSRIEVLNFDGEDISERFELSVENATIYVGVGTFARIPLSVPFIKGEVADGYRRTSVSISPREVEVEGPSKDINSINAIQLYALDVSGISHTIVETYDISAYLEGTNLNIRDGSERYARVTVTVEKEIPMEILVPVDRIEIRGMSGNISLQPGETVRLEVQGIASEIVEFEKSNFVSYVDVTGLQHGVYQLEVMLETPRGVRQTGTEKIEVTIEENKEDNGLEADADNDDG